MLFLALAPVVGDLTHDSLTNNKVELLGGQSLRLFAIRAFRYSSDLIHSNAHFIFPPNDDM